MLAGMSSSHDTDATQEAAEWHARLQSRAVSNEELESFYAWRNDPRNAEAFAAIDEVWADAATLSNDPKIRSALRDIRKGRSSNWRDSFNALFTPGYRILATGVVAAVIALTFMVLHLSRPATYRTGVGETLIVRLDDGSRVTLNTTSRVSVRMSKNARDLELVEGQALFEVSHDANRPFRVTVADSTVTALGTTFEVRKDADGFKVILLEGKISVSPDRGATPKKLLRRGETLDTTSGRSSIGRSDPAVETSWVDGKIDLRNVPLSAAIAEVNRYAKDPIVLDAPSLGSTHVSGAFATGDREAFVAAITALLPLRQTRDADGIIHLRRIDDEQRR